VGRWKWLRNFPSESVTIHAEERRNIATSQYVVIYNCRTLLDLLEVFFYSRPAAIVFPFPDRILFEFCRSHIASDQTKHSSHCELNGFGILLLSRITLSDVRVYRV
jgi:hypothetical protein